jgi:hypothetical protein
MTLLKYWRLPRGRAFKMIWAVVVCPGCCQEVSIGRQVHNVNLSGEVSPSMVCPHCAFHDYVSIEGWIHAQA